MTPRERILAAIEFTGPDRCPIQHYVFPGAIWRHGRALLDLADKYADDFGNAAIKANTKPPLEEEQDIEDVVEWQDGWGTLWRRLRGYTSGEVLRPAIPDWDAWRSYEFPSLPAEEHYEHFAARARERHPEHFVTASGGGFFQRMQSMRGPDNFFIDLAENNDGVHELADRMVEHNLHSIERYVQAGADCITFGDDWGAQDRRWARRSRSRTSRLCTQPSTSTENIRSPGCGSRSPRTLGSATRCLCLSPVPFSLFPAVPYSSSRDVALNVCSAAARNSWLLLCFLRPASSSSVACAVSSACSARRSCHTFCISSSSNSSS